MAQGNDLKNKLIKNGVKESKCEECGNTKWLDSPIPLELHHIDGNAKNNNIENIKLLCANCHALTDNYRGKKNTILPDYFCIDCEKPVVKRALRCKNCENIFRRRHIPDKVILEKEVKEKGLSAVGRKYGVTHTTVRKWLYN